MDVVQACRSAQSCAVDAVVAVREFYAGVVQPDMSAVIFFCSSQYDLDVLAAEMRASFPGVTVVGCTTAGEIGPIGYREWSLVGASFASAHFSIQAGLLGGLADFDLDGGRRFAYALYDALEVRDGGRRNGFALMLVDGLSVREELVARAFQDGIGNLPLVGGSAGDDLRFARTQVYFDGAFHEDAAALLVAHTDCPVHAFKTQHFECLDERLVVTAADAGQRIVTEINGLPAASEYARIAGVRVEDLRPDAFAAVPVVVVINGSDYVRSIRSVNPDGSLTFYCAIEEGLVFRVARATDLLADVRQTFQGIRDALGEPQLTLGFDCVLRNLEMRQQGLKPVVDETYRQAHCVGFCTYGEQFWGVHVNQTLTGLAIGEYRAVGHD